jgi:hypothetical protein
MAAQGAWRRPMRAVPQPWRGTRICVDVPVMADLSYTTAASRRREYSAWVAMHRTSICKAHAGGNAARMVGTGNTLFYRQRRCPLVTSCTPAPASPVQ